MTDYLGHFLKSKTPHEYVFDLHAHSELKITSPMTSFHLYVSITNFGVKFWGITFERNPIRVNINCIFIMIGDL